MNALSRRPHPATLLLAVLIAAFALFFGALAVQQHRVFLTNGLDIGNVDQALWNSAQGRWLQFTLMAPVESRLALHIEPILLLLVPFYWLGLGGPELLLLAQAALVAMGASPMYQLAIMKLLPKPLPTGEGTIAFPPSPAGRGAGGEGTSARRFALLIFPLAYLLLPTLEAAVLYDFHAVTVAPTFLLFGFLALERRHTGRFFLFMILAMACKEDMPLVVAMIGLYAGVAQGRWRLAGATIALAGAWFAVAVLVIQPMFAAGGNIQLDRYAWLGDSPGAMLATLLTRPGLVIEHLWRQANLPGYLAALFFPTAFLALFSPLTLLPMLPPLAVNLLSDNPFTWRLEDFHYGAPLAPFLFISAIYGTHRLAGWLGRWPRLGQSAGFVLLGLLLATTAFTTTIAVSPRWPGLFAGRRPPPITGSLRPRWPVCRPTRPFSPNRIWPRTSASAGLFTPISPTSPIPLFLPPPRCRILCWISPPWKIAAACTNICAIIYWAAANTKSSLPIPASCICGPPPPHPLRCTSRHRLSCPRRSRSITRYPPLLATRCGCTASRCISIARRRCR
jgi:uncharacterized membrane protein